MCGGPINKARSSGRGAAQQNNLGFGQSADRGKSNSKQVTFISLDKE